MNEQVEKLFDQALAEFKAENKYATIVEPDPIQRDFVEKFARLIVNECAKIVVETPVPYMNEDIKNQYGHTWIMACVESRDRIRKHFGVEE